MFLYFCYVVFFFFLNFFVICLLLLLFVVCCCVSNNYFCFLCIHGVFRVINQLINCMFHCIDIKFGDFNRIMIRP